MELIDKIENSIKEYEELANAERKRIADKIIPALKSKRFGGWETADWSLVDGVNTISLFCSGKKDSVITRQIKAINRFFVIAIDIPKGVKIPEKVAEKICDIIKDSLTGNSEYNQKMQIARNCYATPGNENKPLKVFISQPMRDKTNEEIEAKRAEIVNTLKELGYKNFTIIDSFFKDEPKVKSIPLWCLGESFKLLSEADIVYFADGFKNARGCRFEADAASEYLKEAIAMAEVWINGALWLDRVMPNPNY